MPVAASTAAVEEAAAAEVASAVEVAAADEVLAALDAFAEVVLAALAAEVVAEAAAEAESDEAAAAEPPVTPLEDWPAAFLSSAMFVLSLVCSSEILSSMSDVSSPDAWACASCKCHRHVQHPAHHAVKELVRTWMFSAWISPVSLRTLFLILPFCRASAYDESASASSPLRQSIGSVTYHQRQTQPRWRG